MSCQQSRIPFFADIPTQISSGDCPSSFPSFRSANSRHMYLLGLGQSMSSSANLSLTLAGIDCDVLYLQAGWHKILLYNCLVTSLSEMELSINSLLQSSSSSGGDPSCISDGLAHDTITFWGWNKSIWIFVPKEMFGAFALSTIAAWAISQIHP